jgi:hypothetical protein
VDHIAESLASYSAKPPRKYRVGATIELTLKQLRERLFTPQGLTACSLPGVPEDIEVQAVTFNPHRQVVTLSLVPTWSPAEFPDPDNNVYSINASRLRLFWLHETQQAPEQEYRDERVVLDRETPDEVLLDLLHDPVVGPDLKALALNILTLLLKENAGE